MPEKGYAQKRALKSRSRVLTGTADLQSRLEQVCWQDSCPMEGTGLGCSWRTDPLEKSPTLEQITKSCRLWEELWLKSVEDCLLWEGPHTGAAGRPFLSSSRNNVWWADHNPHFHHSALLWERPTSQEAGRVGEGVHIFILLLTILFWFSLVINSLISPSCVWFAHDGNCFVIFPCSYLKSWTFCYTFPYSLAEKGERVALVGSWHADRVNPPQSFRSALKILNYVWRLKVFYIGTWN